MPFNRSRPKRPLLAFSQIVLLAAQVALCLPSSAANTVEPASLKYPAAELGSTVDEYCGHKVADPYRWLEDPDTKESTSWIAKENRLTRSFIDAVPERQAIEKRLTELWNYERCSVPTKRGQKLIYGKNDGLQNQNVLYVKDDPKSEPRVLLDPNKLSEDGTIALAGYDITQDGRLMVYGLSKSGSDWEDWYVKEVATGKDLPDHLKWLKNGQAVFTHDGKGVYYNRYDEPKPGAELKEANYYQKVFYHEVGTPQSQDKLVYERKDEKEWSFDPYVTDDGRYLIIYITHGTSPENGLAVQDLEAPNSKIVSLYKPGAVSHMFVGNSGSRFYLITDEDAPLRKMVTIEPGKGGDFSKLTTKPLIAEAKETLENVSFINNKLICSYLKDAHSVVKVFDQDGKFEREIALPGIGTARGFGGLTSDRETYFSYTSFNTPSVIYHLDLNDYKRALFFQPRCKFNPDDFVSEQIFYKSKDGTRVPMFICHKKGLKLDGNNPAYLYGYGGFDISILPRFSVSELLFMERGGVLAIPSLRGGGEYGETWHQAGMKEKKQNVFDDFIGAAETLIERKYTTSDRLAIAGGSNGGLLVGACITQRPDLYGAAIAAVGVMDMLRFNKFTVGWGWVQEYGSPENKRDFSVLHKYSPLHNVKKGTCYPATLITTADHDDRVIPGHSFKFAAAMQAAQACKKPILIRIDTKAGHGHGKSTKQAIEEQTDVWSFLTRELKIGPVPESKTR